MFNVYEMSKSFNDFRNITFLRNSYELPYHRKLTETLSIGIICNTKPRIMFFNSQYKSNYTSSKYIRNFHNVIIISGFSSRLNRLSDDSQTIRYQNPKFHYYTLNSDLQLNRVANIQLILIFNTMQINRKKSFRHQAKQQRVDSKSSSVFSSETGSVPWNRTERLARIIH